MTGPVLAWEDARPEIGWFDGFFLTMAGPALARLSGSLPAHPRLLHLGCGLGVKTETFRRLGFDPVGVDMDRDLLQRAAEAFPRSRFVAADIQALPFDDATFDVVFSFSTLQLVADKQAVIAESARVLRPGGRALFVENLKGSPFAHGYRAIHAETVAAAMLALAASDRSSGPVESDELARLGR